MTDKIDNKKGFSKVTYLIFAILVAVTIYGISFLLVDPFKEIKSEILETSKTLPKMVDSETRLDLVQFKDKKIENQYTLVNITKSQINVDEIIPGVKESLKINMCKKTKILDNLSKGIEYIFTYKDKDSELISTIIITNSDCK